MTDAVADVVLHSLAVKGFATPDAIGRSAGLDPAAVAAALDRLAAEGLTRHRERIGAWSLTAEGRERHRELLAAEPTAADLDRPYQAFLALDRELKQLCTDWQRHGRSGPLVDRLGSVHARLEGELAAVILARPRFRPYPSRLAAALDRLRAGDDAALARPLTDSYHDIWMELHEDLLLTLGLSR